jgi:hypothetical protein
LHSSLPICSISAPTNPCALAPRPMHCTSFPTGECRSIRRRACDTSCLQQNPWDGTGQERYRGHSAPILLLPSKVSASLYEAYRFPTASAPCSSLMTSHPSCTSTNLRYPFDATCPAPSGPYEVPSHNPGVAEWLLVAWLRIKWRSVVVIVGLSGLSGLSAPSAPTHRRFESTAW